MTEHLAKLRHISQETWDAADVPERADEELVPTVSFKDRFPDLYASWKQETDAKVAAFKIELAQWLDRFSQVDQIEARIAMLETVVEAMTGIHGEDNAFEIITTAMQRTAINARGTLQ